MKDWLGLHLLPIAGTFLLFACNWLDARARICCIIIYRSAVILCTTGGCTYSAMVHKDCASGCFQWSKRVSKVRAPGFTSGDVDGGRGVSWSPGSNSSEYEDLWYRIHGCRQPEHSFWPFMLPGTGVMSEQKLLPNAGLIIALLSVDVQS